VIGDALGQFDAGRVGHGAGPDLGQGEGGVLGSQQDVSAQRQFQPAAAADPVDGGDDGLVQPAQFLQAAEAADTIVAVDRITPGGGLQVPAGAKELLARSGDDGDAQIRVVAEVSEDLAQVLSDKRELVSVSHRR